MRQDGYEGGEECDRLLRTPLWDEGAWFATSLKIVARGSTELSLLKSSVH